MELSGVWYDDLDPPQRSGSTQRDDGDREPHVVVLLHAFPLSSLMWEPLLPRLTPHVRVLLVDLPGLGRSPVPQGPPYAEPPGMDVVARSVLDVLDDAGVERAIVFGISTGGYAALALAALAPDRVAALVLGSTTPWLGAPDVPADRRRTAAELDRSGATEPVMISVQGGLGDTARREQPELPGLLSDLIRGADPAGVAWVARAIAEREDTSRVLADFAGPVLLLFGEEDSESPLDRVAEMASLRSGGSSTTVRMMTGTGHLTALEQPQRVAAELLAFLG